MPRPIQFLAWLLAFSTSISATLRAQESEAPAVDNPHAAAEPSENDPEAEAKLIASPRQLTFEGRRAGEGYFNADGTKMVFQSEQVPGNPFYQIFVMDLETGDLQRVSPGMGKTTCAWIHPEGDRVLFASTHLDPTSEAKQQEEYRLREEASRRYSWDYDPKYDLFVWSEETGQYARLTDALGYDAEASFSPDGSQIVFASNRQAYGRELTEREQEMMKLDPAYMIDLYIMNADGTNVRQLTDVPGYDGGPFFSPDGKRICWRRFSENGATAEVYSMNTDGSDVRRLTEIGAMSWAPFFHPSGDYLIFTTNVHGFANFELYLVRADGQGEPQRVTYTDGFDGLPVFTPDGQHIAWTTNRTANQQSQIFIADWNDEAARSLLKLDDAGPASEDTAADREAALAAAAATKDTFSAADVGRHVDYLTRPELQGRMTGTEGERKATAYVAAYLASLGFEPAGQDGTFFHTFEFPAGASLTGKNSLSTESRIYELDSDWRPLPFSGSGEFDATSIVFAGYGLVVPESEDFEGYDSYVHLDVEGKWVLVFRGEPQDTSEDVRRELRRYSQPRRKVMMARERGAAGVIFVSGPLSPVQSQLIAFSGDASAGGTSLPVISVTDSVAQAWLTAADKDLGELQKALADGSQMMGFDVGDTTLAATIEIERKTGTGRNVLARLAVADEPTAQTLMIGAHVDHLGLGKSNGSLARGDETDMVHYGADDNASGVAAMLEIAQYLAAQKRAGTLEPQRDLLIAAWSGEELGLFGSQAFAEDFYELYPHLLPSPAHTGNAHGSDAHATDANPHADAQPAANATANPHATSPSPSLGAVGGHGASASAPSLYPAVSAYLNLDMVGRLREKLTVQGLGSSPAWRGLVQRRNVPVGLKLSLSQEAVSLPTDAAVFVQRGVPALAAFTGAHEDYHTPRDTADKLNYEGAAQIARLFALTARGLWTADEPLPFELDDSQQDQQEQPRVRMTAYLGTIPDYAGGDIKGVKLSGVGKNGPAEKAGVKGGDIIVELGGRKIENIYDYTYAIEGLKIGEPITMTVERDGKQIKLKVVPGSRQ